MTRPDSSLPTFYHEDGTTCQESVCLRLHPLWESPASREVQAEAERAIRAQLGETP